MATSSPVATGVGASSGAIPFLLLVQGTEQTRVPLERTPFGIGRKTDKDLVIADPRVSRDHAQIVLEGSDLWLVDLGSKHGTFVNGNRVERHLLKRNDRLEFGARDRVYVVFQPDQPEAAAAREFLSQISVMNMPSPGGVPSGAGDLEKLKLFLEAARKLNTSGVVDEVLVTLIDTTLRITHAERGFVFLRAQDKEGTLRLAAGRNSRGELLLDDKTISHSILEDALKGGGEFLVTDTSKSMELASRNSIVAYDLRTVIAIPLRKTQLQQEKAVTSVEAKAPEVLGVLYLDSRFASREITAVSHDILRAIATEAAALVENANLVQAEAAARQYQQELAIAASIQQRLMTVTIPDVPFAAVRAKNLSCREIGGDFYDVVLTDQGLAVIVCDVCGKGVSAAILGSIIQGMVYSQLTAHTSLVDIAAAANKFLCLKSLGEKYATLVIAHIRRDGTLEFVNCGHVTPLLISGNTVTRPKESNLPVGLLPMATYESGTMKVDPGDRLIVVTDGVTEAENPSGEFFGNERLEKSSTAASPFDQIFEDVKEFCGPVPFNDDCTVLELTYKG